MFQARLLGIDLWDDDIDHQIKNDPITYQFLKNPISDSFYLKADEPDISCLKNIIRYLNPCLIILPGGSELEKLAQANDILKGLGMDEKNMSVLFRLSSENGKNFNDFVKNQGLNGPISEETKVVFVSGKLPKTVLKSKIVFNSIINFGFENAHYTLKEFVKNSPNFVYFDTKNTLRS